MRLMRRALAVLLAVTMSVTACPITSYASGEEKAETQSQIQPEVVEVYEQEEYSYTVLEDGTISINGYIGSAQTSEEPVCLEIPAELDGKAVTQIAQEAFAYNDFIDAVMIPECITTVENAAFYHCEDLKVIAFCGKAPTFGFTVAEGCKKLEKIFALNTSDISGFCALLVSDMGEEKAKDIEIAEYDTIDLLKADYEAYLSGLHTAEEDNAVLGEESAQEEMASDASQVETEAGASVEASNEEEDEVAEAVEETQVSTEVVEEAATEEITKESTEEITEVLEATAEEQVKPLETESNVVVAEGTCGENLTWMLDGEGTLTISGTGEMDDYERGSAPWYGYKDEMTAIVLEEGIENVGDYSFSDCMQLNCLAWNSIGLTRIGEYAFYNCYELTGELRIPDTVKEIDDHAFSFCVKLNKLQLNNGLEKIGERAFHQCYSLTGELVIPDSVTEISAEAFCNSGISGLKIGTGSTKIGDMAFLGSYIEGELVIPYTVTEIGMRAFEKCSSITSIVIETSEAVFGTGCFRDMPGVTEISFKGTKLPSFEERVLFSLTSLQTIYVPAESYDAYVSALSGMVADTVSIEMASNEEDFNIVDNSLTQYLGEGGVVVIPSHVERIEANAFKGCTTITKVVLPKNLKYIGQNAFYNCTGLTGSLEIPDSVTNIGDSAFRGCKGLNSLKLGSGSAKIGAYAFYNCSGLTGELSIPDTVTEIGGSAFYKCTGLTGIKLGNNLKKIGGSAFYNCTGLIGELEIPDTVIEIGDSAFQKCSGITGIKFGTGLKKIGKSAFYDCSGLSGELSIPDKVIELGTHAFYGCRSLNSLKLGSGITKIGMSTFWACSSLAGELVIPDNVTEIGASAFSHCGFSSVKLGTGITQIGDSAFNSCGSLTGVLEIPDNVTVLGASAFSDCKGLTGIKLGTGITQIGDSAFWSCSGLNGELVIPDTITEIGSYAFQNCEKLSGIKLGSGIQKIGAYAFEGCLGLTGTLEIPDAVTEMGIYAFQGCKGLSGIKLGAGVTKIEEATFRNCVGLVGELVIPDTVTELGNYAFQYCEGLSALKLGTGITKIGNSVFSGCRALTGELRIPVGINEIGIYAFSGCTNITSIIIETAEATINQGCFNRMSGVTEITFKGVSLPSLEQGALSGSNLANLKTIYVPIESYDAYVSALSGMVADSVSIEIDLSTAIREEDFEIHDNRLVRYLGEGGVVVIPERVEIIDDSAFADCTTITKIVLPKNLQIIRSFAFKNCSGLIGKLIIPDSVVEIGNEAFRGCSGLSELVLGEGLELIPQGAFQECSGLTGELVIPDSVQQIWNNAFLDCSGLTSIDLGQGVTTILNSAFANCTGLTGVLRIPESVNYIYVSAFYNCIGLNGLDLGNDELQLDYGVFEGCSGITGKLVLPKTLRVIGGRCFAEMTNVTSIVIESNNTTVTPDCFTGMTGVKEVFFEDNTMVSGVCGDALRELTNLETIYVPAVAYNDYVSMLRDKIPNTVEIVKQGDAGVTPPPTEAPTATPTLAPTATPIPAPTATPTLAPTATPTLAPTEAPTATPTVEPTATPVITPPPTKPPLPQIENVEVSKVYSKTVVLTWDKDVTGQIQSYIILRDGVEIAETTDNTFTDRNLETDKEYTYTIYGTGTYDRVTDAVSVTVVTVMPNITDLKTDDLQNRLGLENRVYVSVSDDKNLDDLDGEAVVGKLYYLAGEERILIGEGVQDVALSNEKERVYIVDWDLADIADGKYELVFVLTDIDGVSDEYSEFVTVDQTVPEQIVNVTAISDVSAILLTWSISKEVDTTIYQIYRKAEGEEDFVLLAELEGRNTLSYADKSVVAERTYYYYVVGANDYGQVSIPSKVAEGVLILDTEAPVVTKLTPANATTLSGNVTISLTAQDNQAVTLAKLYVSVDGGDTWELLTEWSNTEFTTVVDTTGYNDGEIQIKGVAYDKAGNESNALIYAYQVNNVGPEKVTGLEYTGTDVTITLSWDNVKDEDISFYRVEKLNAAGTYEKLADVDKTLGLNIYNLAPDTEYVYRVVGYDTQGNRGIPSDDIVTRTLEDTVAPVITKIRPTDGYYSEKINLAITATDEYNVESIRVQCSVDGITWNDIYEKSYTDIQKTRTLTYDLSLKDYEEGYIFIRALAKDRAQNESDSGKSAPFVQYMVDKTAPVAPVNVKAVGNNGFIEVTWTQGTEDDLHQYAVYRSESEDGEYVLIKNAIAKINYIDRDVKEGITYYYKVKVNDKAGNLSEFSDCVAAEVIKDTEKPVIRSVYPQSGEKIGTGYRTISVLATDNNALDTILIEYSKDGSDYVELRKISGINAYSKTMEVQLPIEGLENDDKVYVRVQVTDKSGNLSESYSCEYVVDTIAPEADKVSAEYMDEQVTIKWNSNLEEDLIGYRIYRKTGESGKYSLIAQRQAVKDRLEYTCTDYNLSLEKTTYIYKVEAVDGCGNTSAVESEAISIPDRSMPTAVISCEVTQEVGVEYYIDATGSYDNSEIVSYFFDFGDGTTGTEKKPVHSYSEVGEYTVTLTVTDDDGNQGVCSKVITVKERALVGTTEIKVVDENGVAVVGAPVYFDLGEENQVVKTTDSKGDVTFTAEVGKHTIGCIIANNEWLPAKKDIIITAGEITEVKLTLVHHVMIEGAFEIRRMTFDEIVAAGIDVTKSENQYMVEVNVALQYGKDTVETSFTYNETTKQTIAKPTIVTTPDGEKRQFVPVVISTNAGNGNGFGGGDYTFSKEATIAYLDIPVGASTLKEFFHVNLHIINNAGSEFSMLDNVIELNLPDGLTIMDTTISEKTPVVQLAEIKGQTTETITWILRGDKVGEYYLSADYSGILGQFNEVISAQFIATEPIEVLGLSNMKLKIEIPEELDHGTFYYNVSLTNEGKQEVYMPRIDTGDVLIETELYNPAGVNVSDSMVLNAEQVNELGVATSIMGELDRLLGGYRLMKHYMCINQTNYTDLKQKLEEYSYEVKNTYGLDIEIVTRPVSYFKSNLSANINAAEKADLTFTDNQSAFEYLMSNDNYIYWSMYASTTDEMKGALTSNAEEQLWNILSFLGGDGSFKELFGDGEGDAEAIRTIILDAMEISVEGDDYSKYYNILNWTKAFKDWLKGEGYGEWTNVVVDKLSKALKNWSKEKLEQTFVQIGESLPRTMELIYGEYKWEVYKAVYEGEYMDLENLIFAKWKYVVEEYYYESYEVFAETDASKFVHELFSKDGFKTVWKAMGIATEYAGKIVDSCKDASVDISLYFEVQSNLDSCNMFIDTIINNMDEKTGDAKKVVKEAKVIKEKFNELDPWGSFFEKIVDKTFWMGVNYAKKAAIKKLDITPNAYVKAIKVALKIAVKIGDNIFNVSERHDIADNIRFVSCISTAFRKGIYDARAEYSNTKTDDAAKKYMQLISYFINIRAIGESQVAAFGISYEVLQGVFDSRQLFLTVKEMSGALDAKSWIEWRDFVEDRISMLRVQLLKNPLSVEMSGTTAPVVTFDYTKEQTAQIFSSEYEYSVDGGKTWNTCEGTAIRVPKQSYAIELLVRRINSNSVNENLTTRLMVYGMPSLRESGIRVLQTKDGYRVENLDHTRAYEVSFEKEAQKYGMDDELKISIPKGSYSYEYATEEEYGYIYIRSVADPERYASFVYAPPIYSMVKVQVVQEGSGSITGIGSYEYGEEVTLLATADKYFEFAGWYENEELLDENPTLSWKAYEDRVLTAKFIQTFIPVSLITINKTELTLQALETFELEATAYPVNADNRDIKWTSSDESVAIVTADGQVKALAKGTCEIIAEAMDGSGITKSCTVTVTNNVYMVDSANDLESSHPYENNSTDVWQYSQPGAKRLFITFHEDTCMQDGADYLYILDGEGKEVGKYTGKELSGQILEVNGDKVIIRMETDASEVAYGFKVTHVTEDVKYTIVYDKNSASATGTMEEQEMLYQSEEKLLPNEFVNAGYTFDGWNTKPDGTGEKYTSEDDGSLLTMKDGDKITLYAQWKIEEYTIVYHLNGGLTVSENPSVYDVNTDTITLNSPVRCCYDFAGWYTNEEFTGEVLTAIVKGSTGNKELYAKWEENGKDHDWDVGVVTKEPTQQTTGVRHYTCQVCEATKDEVIPMLIPVPNKPYKIVNVVSGIHVYWNAIEGIEKYGLWRSETGKEGTYKWIANPQVAHFTDTKVVSGKTYYYKVTAMNVESGKHGEKSKAIGITYVSTPDIAERVNRSAGIYLGWNKVSGATGYAIYRKPYEGEHDWVRVATITNPDTLYWIDTGVKNANGTVYRYTIRALAGSNRNTLSGCRPAGRTMVRMTSRTLSTVTKQSATSIKCSWDTTKQAHGYQVRFMVGDSVYKVYDITDYKIGTKTFTGLKAGQTYKVQVRAYKKVDGIGTFYSAWSVAKNVGL